MNCREKHNERKTCWSYENFQCFLVQIFQRAQDNILVMLVCEQELKSGLLCQCSYIPANDAGRMNQWMQASNTTGHFLVTYNNKNKNKKK